MAAVLDIESGRLHRIGAGRIGGSFDWLGAKLVVQSPGNRSLVLLDPATDSVVPFITGDWTTLFFQPRVRTGGDRIAFMANRLPGSVGIWSKPIGSGAANWSLLLEGQSRPIRWSRDGTVLYAAEVGGDQFNQLIAIPTGGGTPRVVAAFGPEVAVEDVSADGRTIIVNQLVKQSDVWMAAVPRRTPR